MNLEKTDVHAHLVPPEAAALRSELRDPDALLASLDARGLECAFVSVPPPFYGRGVNDGLERCVRGRLQALAYLPIDHPGEAVSEAARRTSVPWAGVVIASSAGDTTLADDALEPLWQVLDRDQRFVLVHPVEAPDARLRPFYLSHLLGFPYETALAAACLVFSGILSRYPNIRFCLAHAGGATPALAGRWQRGYETRRPGIPTLELSPIQALRRLWVDSVAHSNEVLDLARRVFAGVLPGSDWPYPLGAWQ